MTTPEMHLLSERRERFLGEPRYDVDVLSANDQRALTNRFCGIVKAVQNTATAQDTTIADSLISFRLKSEITEFADMLQSRWPERFSAKWLRSRLDRLVMDVAGEPIRQGTYDRFESFLTELDTFSEKKLCVVPIDGIALADDEPVNLGPFRIRRVTEHYLERMNQLQREMLSRTRHSREEQRAFADEDRKHAERVLMGRTVLELEIIADAEKAHAAFVDKAMVLMDLLQAATDFVEFCDSAEVALGGYSHASRYHAWVMALDEGTWLQTNTLTGRLADLPVNSRTLAAMRNAGILRLAETLARNPSELEGALLRGVHWFSQATVREPAGHTTLCLAVCLESVLKSSSARTIAEGVALLVGKSLDQRRAIYQLVREAYGVRNEVVHEGDASKAFPRQLAFKRVVRDLITVVTRLTDEFSTREHLIEHIDRLRFS